MIPFSPPRIDDKIINEVTDALKSGWITTGPKTKQLEKDLAHYCGVPKVLCVSSATTGMELVLRWFGVGPGDEVIVPAYTYCATANVVVHTGATPVMVDCNGEDFNIDVEKIKAAITPKTKVIMPVDFSGLPCDYDDINELVRSKEINKLFTPGNGLQKQLGRILVLSDAAHSLGALYYGNRTGALCDFTVFSFHAVKNLTTAEGGAICMNLPDSFDKEELYKYMNTLSLHGQSKDALAKTQKGAWEYDVVESGYKCNMTDIQAAIGLIELGRYEDDTLLKRKEIFDFYSSKLESEQWAEIPEYETSIKVSSYHVYPLRIKGVTLEQRNEIIQKVFDEDVSVNVHFKPLPLLTAFKKKGYDINDFPVAYDNYKREISLPVFYNLSKDQMQEVVNAVIKSVEAVI